jgi:toxin ParE1/3/4
MNSQIRRTRQVREDIIRIYRYLRLRSPDAADRVFDAIQQSIKSLVNTPGIGTYWNSSDPRLQGLRVVTVRRFMNYLIFFRVVRGGVEVFRVIHGARELQPLIDEIQFDFEDESDEI